MSLEPTDQSPFTATNIITQLSSFQATYFISIDAANRKSLISTKLPAFFCTKCNSFHKTFVEALYPAFDSTILLPFRTTVIVTHFPAMWFSLLSTKRNSIESTLKPSNKPALFFPFWKTLIDSFCRSYITAYRNSYSLTFYSTDFLAQRSALLSPILKTIQYPH